MFPDKIYYDYDLKIEILKRQGISAYKIEENRFYVIYSIYSDINIGDYIIDNLSEINVKGSLVTVCCEDRIIKKNIYNVDIEKNEYIDKFDCLMLKLVNFEEFKINKLKDNKYKIIVLDLRANTGGLITDMLNCLSFFLHDDTNLQLLNLNTVEVENYTIKAKKRIGYEKMIIIIDRRTYSSSEIFYKLLSKQHDVEVLGESFGKDCIYKQVYKDNSKIILEKKYLVL